MDDALELKQISSTAIGRAVERAEHYRLLNDPAQAESICLDVLEVDPTNQRCLIALLLALTDQFGDGVRRTRATKEVLGRLEGEYQRAYYAGIVHERQGRSYITSGLSAAFAYDCLVDAMECYEKAESLSAGDSDDPILHWNSCLRTIRQHRLRPLEDLGEQPLE